MQIVDYLNSRYFLQDLVKKESLKIFDPRSLKPKGFKAIIKNKDRWSDEEGIRVEFIDIDSDVTLFDEMDNWIKDYMGQDSSDDLDKISSNSSTIQIDFFVGTDYKILGKMISSKGVVKDVYLECLEIDEEGYHFSTFDFKTGRSISFEGDDVTYN